MARLYIDVKTIAGGLVEAELKALNADLGLGLTAEAIAQYGTYPHVRAVPEVRERYEGNGEEVLHAMARLDPKLYGRLTPVAGSREVLRRLTAYGDPMTYYLIRPPYHDAEVSEELTHWITEHGYSEGMVATQISVPDFLFKVGLQQGDSWIFSNYAQFLIKEAHRGNISDKQRLSAISLVAFGCSYIPDAWQHTPLRQVTALSSWDKFWE